MLTEHDEAIPFEDAEPLNQRLIEGIGEAALLFRREATGWDMGVENRQFRFSMLAVSWIFRYLDDRST
jgi:hypothetical protein